MLTEASIFVVSFCLHCIYLGSSKCRINISTALILVELSHLDFLLIGIYKDRRSFLFQINTSLKYNRRGRRKKFFIFHLPVYFRFPFELAICMLT
jgi:hypothetical protein